MIKRYTYRFARFLEREKFIRRFHVFDHYYESSSCVYFVAEVFAREEVFWVFEY